MVRTEHIWDKALHCQVTLKHGASAAREYALMNMFDSPEIIRPIALRKDTLVLPHCMERSSDGIVGFCSERTAWKFLHDVASGLAAIHGKGYIHHDIKPSNILITDDGFAISDFGACFKQGEDNAGWEDDATSHSFSAPEWSAARKDTTSAYDIWALGASVFQIVMGAHIFGGRGGNAQKETTPLPSLPKGRYSEELSALVCRCLAFRPEDRPEAAEIVTLSQQHLQSFIKSERKLRCAAGPKYESAIDTLWPEDIDS